MGVVRLLEPRRGSPGRGFFHARLTADRAGRPPSGLTGYLSWAGAAIPARAATVPQQILDKPFPRGRAFEIPIPTLGRMHRHLAGGFGEGDERRAVARDPPDVQVAMRPRAREPLVQLGE